MNFRFAIRWKALDDTVLAPGYPTLSPKQSVGVLSVAAFEFSPFLRYQVLTTALCLQLESSVLILTG